MITGQAIYSLLSGDATVAGIVGNRINPNIEPQDEGGYPSLTYYSDSLEQSNTMSGPSKDCVVEVVKIECRAIGASAYADVTALAMAVINAMRIIRTDVAGIPIQGIFLKDDTDLEETLSNVANFAVHRKDLEFKVVFNLP